VIFSESTDLTAIPAQTYTFDQLAEIYNQARVDYIVPMPMNGKRMAEYIYQYDVDLTLSVVALNSEQEICGLNMVGLRGTRSWATRLGVIPNRRGHHIGQFMMENLLKQSIALGVQRCQLEVIKGNEPAYRLFLKLGFETTRELLVIRRPPGKVVPEADFDVAKTQPLDRERILSLLNDRVADAAWTEETPSLLKAGSLNGLSLTLPSGETGWIVYQVLPFQLTHFVIAPGCSAALNRALIYHVHKQNPLQDTKIENLPADHPTWDAFQALGYLETFRRIEMIKPL
jgi:ribosomal protein S18 acetylase RimI-like enzyme